jgi:hypothetical protein
MNPESITLYFTKKHLRVCKIETETSIRLGEASLGYSTITRDLRKQALADFWKVQSDECKIERVNPASNVVDTSNQESKTWENSEIYLEGLFSA